VAEHASDSVDPRWYRSRSLWLDSLTDDPLTPRPRLPGDLAVDVAIVGGGYTGLWTAYYLSSLEPTLRIAVLEAEIAGFGASGRNGGWCSSIMPMSLGALAAEHGREVAVTMQRAMHATVEEVGRVTAAEQIDCDFVHGGYFSAATNAAHVPRLRDEIASWRSWGFGEDDHRLLDATEAAGRIAVDGLLGAAFTPHCAALHPAKLVRGLARLVEARGVAIYEQTKVTSIEPWSLETEHGRVRADVIVRATEGYTPTLPGSKRDIAPIYSLMIATEPLPHDVWEQIGWAGRETFNDARHLIIYAQRTADGRIAFGGRGAPYHFASRIDPTFDHDERVHASIHQTMRTLFPQIGDARITHRWGGPIGVPRDWHSSVGLDPATGLAWAGGYVGDGVATTNLAGRTLADLILRRDTDLTRLAWVGHRSRRWEPEPIRWLAINGTLRLPTGADRHEFRTGRRDRARSWLLDRLLGH
jgi:glycine/D-amino acid oxidase-like deaminating enzyme